MLWIIRQIYEEYKCFVNIIITNNNNIILLTIVKFEGVYHIKIKRCGMIDNGSILKQRLNNLEVNSKRPSLGPHLPI